MGAMRCHAAGVCSFSFSSSLTRHPSSPTCMPHFTSLHFNPLTPSASSSPAKPSAKSYPTLREPPPLPSKPDRPTLIDLLISTIVLYLPIYPYFPSSFLRGGRDTFAVISTTSMFFYFFFSTFPVMAIACYHNLLTQISITDLITPMIYCNT